MTAKKADGATKRLSRKELEENLEALQMVLGGSKELIARFQDSEKDHQIKSENDLKVIAQLRRELAERDAKVTELRKECMSFEVQVRQHAAAENSKQEAHDRLVQGALVQDETYKSAIAAIIQGIANATVDK